MISKQRLLTYLAQMMQNKREPFTLTINMRKAGMTYLLFIIVMLISCSRIQDNGHIKVRDNSSVVLIFENAPNQTTTDRFTGKKSSLGYETVSYLDTSGAYRGFSPRRYGRDTLCIPTYNGYAEILHIYQATEKIFILLKGGDTVLVTYDQRLRPCFNSLVSPQNSSLYNPVDQKYTIHNNGFSIKTILSDPYFISAYRYLNSPQLQKQYKGLSEGFKGYMVDLDSLSAVFDCYKPIILSRLDTISSISEVYGDYYKRMLLGIGDLSPQEVVSSDSLMHYISSYVIAQDYYKRNNSTATFEAAANDTSMAPIARREVLKRALTNIQNGEYGWHPYNQKTIEFYSKRYTEITKDTLNNKASDSIPKVAGSYDYKYDLILEDTDGTRTDFSSVLEENEGKIVYVDFWASWCGPCRAQTPYTKKLMEQFAQEDIAFVFISTDSDKKAWLKAMQEEEIKRESSYRILNPDSKFLQDINLRYIPRYLVFSRDSHLLNADAPRPSTDDIGSLMTRLLNE